MRPPPGWNSYLVTFKDEDIHPIEKDSMKGCAVRVFAPSDEAAAVVVRFRFGKAFYQLHDEKKTTPYKLISYPQGIYETLIYQKPDKAKIISSMN